MSVDWTDRARRALALVPAGEALLAHAGARARYVVVGSAGGRPAILAADDRREAAMEAALRSGDVAVVFDRVANAHALVFPPGDPPPAEVTVDGVTLRFPSPSESDA